MDIRTPVPTIYGDWAQRFGEIWKTQVAKLREKFGSDVEDVRMPGEAPTDVPIVYVKRQSIIDVLRFVKSEPGFEYEFLSDLTASDESPAEQRFEVIYNLFALNKGPRIRLKVRLREDEPIPTAIPVWKGADWAEREVWDMFGVKFEGHPDLRRILMDDRWQGHPLRKDYPLRGYQVFTEPMQARPELLE
jgi:NADH-quinone oxidoreductase subunit C